MSISVDLRVMSIYYRSVIRCGLATMSADSLSILKRFNIWCHISVR